MSEQRIAELCAAGRLAEAAELCSAGGAHARAADLYEQSCEFGRAADAALLAGNPRGALRLAALSHDEALCERAIEALFAVKDDAVVRLTAADLGARGQHRASATLYRRLGDHVEAALAFERDGNAHEAALSYEAAGQPAQAARALEAALREAAEDPDALRAHLGELYARHAKHQAAVRVLQQIALESPWRRKALAPLARSLEALGYTHALADLEGELEAHAVEMEVEPATATVETMLYGRYRVTSEFAVTPHARLVEAVDVLSGERVAVKIMASRAQGRDALARFVREARALTELRHPNVVPLKQYLPEGPALVLQWMGGGSLRELLERETISPARAAEIARAVLSALSEAHRLGILHRDVKPSNLLFDEGGTARLSDFGAAHMSDSEATVTAAEIGTVAYMSPEQRMGKAATVKSDIYAVGVLLYEMLTGDLPPRSPSEIRLSSAHPDLDARHDALLARLLALGPEERPPSALEAREEIEEVVWPRRIVARKRRPRSVPPPVEPLKTEGRLIGAASPETWHDTWLGRDVWLVPLELSARAAAFARADHPALPTVLRTDAQALWVEAPMAEPLAAGAPLTAHEIERLRAALGALHRAGAAHGAVDRQHLYRHAGEVYLAWPRSVREGDPAADIAALDSLSA
ncbi:MAG TPA: serine/threonine-protein kinase [Polyangiaceae bacterium]|nr:serine/threonine-protein kinase [Polyangiaceae bacterium]